MSVKQKPNGRWAVDAVYKSKHIFRATVDTEEEARELERKALADARLNGHASQTKNSEQRKATLTLSTLKEIALRDPKLWKGKGNAQPDNADQVIAHFNNCSPFDINRLKILEYIEVLEKGRPKSPEYPKGVRPICTETIRKKLSALSTLLLAGVLHEYYKAGDVYDVALVMPEKEGGGRERVLSEPEVLKYHKVLSMIGGADELYFLLLLYVGGRTTETCEIQLKDIDWEGGRLRMMAGKKGNAPNERFVAILPQFAKQLANWTKGMTDPDTFIFGDTVFTSAQRVRERFKWINKCFWNFKDVIPHTMRHTCITRMIRANVNIVTVQKWVGHSNITTTMKYVKFDPKMLDQVEAALDGLEDVARGAKTWREDDARGVGITIPEEGVAH